MHVCVREYVCEGVCVFIGSCGVVVCELCLQTCQVINSPASCDQVSVVTR